MKEEIRLLDHRLQTSDKRSKRQREWRLKTNTPEKRKVHADRERVRIAAKRLAERLKNSHTSLLLLADKLRRKTRTPIIFHI
jgi:hypothetical protein